MRRTASEVAALKTAWEREVDRVYAPRQSDVISQGEVIGIVNNSTAPTDVVLCAAGSLPGDLHKLWRTRDAGRVSPRIRLLVHGLRDRRRARRARWRSPIATSTSWSATDRI